MNVYDNIHFNIYKILPYQRNFNFVNSIRGLGKTYTTQMFCIDKAITRSEEFIYIVRTQREKNENVFEKAYSKVCQYEFSEYKFKFEKSDAYIIEKDSKRHIGYCIALSEYVKIKNLSYPTVKYLQFDEYIIDERTGARYVGGWREPELFLNIYHTADRDEDRIKCFLLANNLKFLNPYHIYPAFNIPRIKPGEIWTSENILFWIPKPSEKLQNIKSKSKFDRMIAASDYGNSANTENYAYDDNSFIEKISGNARYLFTLKYNGEFFGVFVSYKESKIYVSDSYNLNNSEIYALTLADHSVNTMLAKNKDVWLKFFTDNFKNGNVRFTNEIVKEKIKGGIYLIL